jgi:tetratricopeptide (TPR) repeat protein
MELKKRGWQQFGMQALSEPERETIVVRYLAEYHKSLNPEQIKRIATDYKCGHPLFLKTVLEELCLIGRHEELDAKIESYLEVTGTEDLFQRVLERLEEDYNMRAVRDVMVLLSASRSGLDERELSELSGLARLKIATMMAGLDYHLVRKEGRLTFFHDYLRRAVEKRYLSDEAKQRTIHVQIAEYFQSGVTASIVGGGRVPQRMASELAYQRHAAGSIDRLRECLSSMPVFLTLYDGPTVYEVLRYWTGMDTGTDVAGSYRRGLASWAMEDAGERSRGMGQVADLLERLGQWSEAMELGRERLATAIEYGEKSEEAVSRRSIGWLLQLRGENSEALEELRQALELFTELGDRNGVARAIGNMGGVYYGRGEYDRALECYERQLSIATELGDRRGVSVPIGNMGLVYSSRGEYDRALECYERQLRIAEELGDRSGVSVAIGNMGNVYSSRGEYDRALASYERQLNIAEELGDRLSVSIAIGNMGNVYSSRGEYDRALESYERKLSIAEELGDRLSVSVAIGTMGHVYSSRGEYDRALENFQRAAKEHRAIGFRYGLIYWLQGTAGVLVELVQADEASPSEGRPRRSRPWRSRIIIMPEYLPTYVSGATEETWQAMSLQHARECAEECVTISEELQKSNTLFGGRVLLARIEAAEGDIDSALESLNAILLEANEDEQRAELHYWLWKISGSPSSQTEALGLYKGLAEKIPKHEYRVRIDELSRPVN